MNDTTRITRPSIRDNGQTSALNYDKNVMAKTITKTDTSPTHTAILRDLDALCPVDIVVCMMRDQPFANVSMAVTVPDANGYAVMPWYDEGVEDVMAEAWNESENLLAAHEAAAFSGWLVNE